MSFLSNFYRDVAIDFGTTNTLVFVRGIGIVVNEPSIIARATKTGKTLAIGEEALIWHEKIHPGINTLRPFMHGTIADYQATQELLKGFIKKTSKQFLQGIRRLVISIPYCITEVEKRAVLDFADQVGAKKVYLVYDSIAAAIGLGINLTEPMGHMIVDIGGGTTEIIVMSLNGIASGESMKVAGTDFTEMIIRYFRKEYNLVISERCAEEIKLQIGSATKLDKEKTIIVRGIDLASSLPLEQEIDSVTIREIITPSLNQIIATIRKCLEALIIKPEISVDILDNGLFLVGGGALMNGIQKKFYDDTKIPVHICEDPTTVVVRGAGEILEDIKKYKPLFVN